MLRGMYISDRPFHFGLVKDFVMFVAPKPIERFFLLIITSLHIFYSAFNEYITNCNNNNNNSCE